MGTRTKIYSIAFNILHKIIKIFGGQHAAHIYSKLSEDLIPEINVETKYGIVRLFSLGGISHWRAETFLTKELDTIEWIDGFDKNDIFWDIGANIGTYSIYAALKGLQVVSFEPAPGNYYLLSRNVEINNLDSNINSYCLAFSNSTKLDTFFMADTALGAAHNSFSKSIDQKGQVYSAKFNQAMIGFTIDEFISKFRPDMPSHIKIDVDGLEDKVIEGAVETLKDKRVKSVLIELDSERKNYCENIIKALDDAGLKLYKKEGIKKASNGDVCYISNHIFIRE